MTMTVKDVIRKAIAEGTLCKNNLKQLEVPPTHDMQPEPDAAHAGLSQRTTARRPQGLHEADQRPVWRDGRRSGIKRVPHHHRNIYDGKGINGERVLLETHKPSDVLAYFGLEAD